MVVADAASKHLFELRSAVDGLGIKSAKKAKHRRGSLEQGRHDVFVLKASSGRDRDRWVAALQSEVTRTPFAKLVDAKRARLTSAKSSSELLKPR